MSSVLKTNKSVLIGGALVAGLGLAAIATESFASDPLTLTWTCDASALTKQYDAEPDAPNTPGIITVDVAPPTGSEVLVQSFDFAFATTDGTPSGDVGSKLAIQRIVLAGADAADYSNETTDGQSNTIYEIPSQIPVINPNPNPNANETTDSDFNVNHVFVNCSDADIEQKELNIVNVTAENKTYDGTTFATLNTSGAAISGGIVPGDTVVLDKSSAIGTFNDKNVANDITVTTDRFRIDNPNYLLVQPEVTADITKAAAPTVTASGTKTYGVDITTSGNDVTGDISDLSFSVVGLKGSDSIDSVEFTIDSSDNGLDPDADVGDYDISSKNASVTDFDPDNYETVVHATGTLTVNKRAITITADDDSKTYGDSMDYGSGELTFEISNNTTNSSDDTFDSVTLASNGDTSTASRGTYDIDPSDVQGSFSDSNYTISYSPGTLTVNPAALTITSTFTGSKTYGEEIDTTSLTWTENTDFTPSGLVNDDAIDSVTISSVGTNATENAGTYAVEISDPVGTQFSAANYNINYDVDGTLTVNRANVTVSADTRTKTYGSPASFGSGDTNFTTSFSGKTIDFGKRELINGEFIDTVTISAITTPDDGTGTNDDVGTYELGISAATGSGFRAENYIFQYESGDLEVTELGVTITITFNDEKDYGTALSYSSLTDADFDHTSLAPEEDITSINISSSGEAIDAPVDADLGQTGIQNYDIVGSSPSGTGFDSNNYTVSWNYGTLTVKPLAVTVSSEISDTIEYGQDGPSYGSGNTQITYSALRNDDQIDSVTAELSEDASSLSPDNYSVTISDPVGSNTGGGTFLPGNYDFSFNAGTLTVEPAVVTISVDRTKTYGDSLFSNSAASGTVTSNINVTGFNNDDSVTSVTVTSSAGHLPDAAVDTYTGSLTVSNIAGISSTNYDIRTEAGDLIVDEAPLTITAANATKVYGETALTYTTDEFSVSGLKNNETVGGVSSINTSGNAADAPVGTYALEPLTPIGGTFDINNYEVFPVNGTLTVTARPIDLTIDFTDTKIYGTELNYTTLSSADFTYVSSDLVGSQTITQIDIASDGEAAGAGVDSDSDTPGIQNYDITGSNATGSGFVEGNYNINYIPGTLTVDPFPLTVESDVDETKVYGSERSAYNGRTLFNYYPTLDRNGTLPNGEVVESVTLTSDGQARTADVAVYDVEPQAPVSGSGGFNPSNYLITYESEGTLEVTKAPLVITAEKVSKVYGESLTFGTGESGFYTSPEVLPNDDEIDSVTLTLATGSGAQATDAVGNYVDEIIPSAAIGDSFNASNYEINYVDGDLEVTKFVVTIEAEDITKTVGDLVTLGRSEDGFTLTPDTLPNGDSIDSVELTSAGAAESAEVGRYDIETSDAQGTFDPANYAISYSDVGYIDVLAAPVTGGGGGFIPVQAPVITNQSASGEIGSTITLSGANLNLVKSVTIGGEDAEIVSATSTNITISIPEDLDSGSSDIVLNYGVNDSIRYSDVLTLSDASTDEDGSNPATETNYWTTALSESEIKMYAKNIIGLGKVQFFHNGQEVAWVNAEDASDPKLRVIESGPMEGANYLVRTRALVPGKNVFEIYVDGVRVERRSQGF